MRPGGQQAGAEATELPTVRVRGAAWLPYSGQDAGLLTGLTVSMNHGSPVHVKGQLRELQLDRQMQESLGSPCAAWMADAAQQAVDALQLAVSLTSPATRREATVAASVLAAREIMLHATAAAGNGQRLAGLEDPRALVQLWRAALLSGVDQEARESFVLQRCVRHMVASTDVGPLLALAQGVVAALGCVVVERQGPSAFAYHGETVQRRVQVRGASEVQIRATHSQPDQADDLSFHLSNGFVCAPNAGNALPGAGTEGGRSSSAAAAAAAESQSPAGKRRLSSTSAMTPDTESPMVPQMFRFLCDGDTVTAHFKAKAADGPVSEPWQMSVSAQDATLLRVCLAVIEAALALPDKFVPRDLVAAVWLPCCHLLTQTTKARASYEKKKKNIIKKAEEEEEEEEEKEEEEQRDGNRTSSVGFEKMGEK